MVHTNEGVLCGNTVGCGQDRPTCWVAAINPGGGGKTELISFFIPCSSGIKFCLNRTKSRISLNYSEATVLLEYHSYIPFHFRK